MTPLKINLVQHLGKGITHFKGGKNKVPMCQNRVFIYCPIYYSLSKISIYNLNLWDKSWGSPVEQLENSSHFAIENADLLKVFVSDKPHWKHLFPFPDKYPSTCNIYSSVLVSLQIIGGPQQEDSFLLRQHYRCSFTKPRTNARKRKFS